MKQALIIVDVQNDFCPGGALPVPHGDKVVSFLNRYITICVKANVPVFASRDWHSRTTKHFKKFGGLWPAHCVQKTKGARFHPKLKLPASAVILSKGMDPKKDSYSAFDAVDSHGTGLLTLLRRTRIEKLLIGGLAADYCVKATVLEALKKGFRVGVLVDAMRGVNINPDDSKKAVTHMTKAGAKKLTVQAFKV